MNPFHYLFDKLYPLIRWYHETVKGNPWFSQIEPHIWLGGAPTHRADYDFLLAQGINAVLDIRAEREDNRDLYARHDIAYRRLPVFDMLVPDAAQFDSGVDFIADQLAQGRSVLVHCAKGRSRSAVLLVAYYMRHRGMRYDEAVAYLTARRRLVRQDARHRSAVEAWAAQPHTSTITEDAAA